MRDNIVLWTLAKFVENGLMHKGQIHEGFLSLVWKNLTWQSCDLYPNTWGMNWNKTMALSPNISAWPHSCGWMGANPCSQVSKACGKTETRKEEAVVAVVAV